VAKYSNLGTLSWSTIWGGTATEYSYDIVQASDGGYTITGNTRSFGYVTAGSLFLAKFTELG
jgi:hypothetical protein